MAPAKLQVLLIGKGTREHALAWKLSKSPLVQHIYVVPGNGGTARGLHNVSNVEDVSGDNYPGLVALARKLRIGLVVVGPDSAIVDGIEGYFRAASIPCFAPSKAAAELEGSKVFAKEFMTRYAIPTADYRSFSDFESARDYLATTSHRVVIKVSGLAAGKGVIIPSSPDEAQLALREIKVDGKFESAGSAVVIEEYLEGDEISILTFSDGITTKTLSPGQDHKRIFDGDEGPNTGGMGVYAPTPVASSAIMTEIEDRILKPTFAGLRSEGRTFKGMLFTGLILTATGLKVLEYNARFGDPETQSIVPLLSEGTDLAEVMLACTEGHPDGVNITISPGFACNVVVAVGGYPGPYTQGAPVELSRTTEDVLIFHAGTKIVDGRIRTAGGRVFTVTAIRPTLEEAVAAAYKGVGSIRFENMFFRRDIASRALPSKAKN